MGLSLSFAKRLSPGASLNLRSQLRGIAFNEFRSNGKISLRKGLSFFLSKTTDLASLLLA
jgi:hypothetical protein